MFISNENDLVTCIVCHQVFCCATCREKHEETRHDKNMLAFKSGSSPTSSQNNDSNSCPICEKRPLPLHSHLPTTLLRHIQLEHLPLKCEKCSQIYEKIDDLKVISKCKRKNIKTDRKLTSTQSTSTALANSQSNFTNNNNDYNLVHDLITTNQSKIDIKVNRSAINNSNQSLISIQNSIKSDLKSETKKPTLNQSIAIQTSPQLSDRNYNSNHITPLSVINMRWKNKGGKSSLTNEDFISDSVSSIRNISAMNNTYERYNLGSLPNNNNNNNSNLNNNNNNNRGKIIRTTSTPVQIEIVSAKPKEPLFFNASAGVSQVSSIHNSGSIASDESPALPPTSDKTKNGSYNQNGRSNCSSKDGSHGGYKTNIAESSLSPSWYQRRKMANNGRTHKLTAVTPLRQVMSKSIQKAMVEHGGMPVSAVKSQYLPASLDSPDSINSHSGLIEALNQSEALDLRLSPVVRRAYQFERFGSRNNQSKRRITNGECYSQNNQQYYFYNDINCNNQHSDNFVNIQQGNINNNIKYIKNDIGPKTVILSAHKTTTESIVITKMEKTSTIASISSKNTITTTSNSNHYYNSTHGSTPNSSYNTAKSTDISNGLKGVSYSNSAVYKSCSQVEILTTKTELNNINLVHQSTAKIQHNNNMLQVQKVQINNNGIGQITPISSIPGAIIHKKLIKFETPNKSKGDNILNKDKIEIFKNTNKDNDILSTTSSSALNSTNLSMQNANNSDIFYTPNNTIVSSKDHLRYTPVIKVSEINHNLDNYKSNSNRRFVPRKLSGHFAVVSNKEENFIEQVPTSFKECAQSTAFSHIENLCSDEDENNDDIDESKINYNVRATLKKHQKIKTKVPSKDTNNKEVSSKNAESIWTKMTSLIRFPSIQCTNSNANNSSMNLNPKSTSILKRCASIAGSLVKVRSVIEEKEIQSLKRKRAHTIDNQVVVDLGAEDNEFSTFDFQTEPVSPTLSTSTKRFRIHGRRPIDRLCNNC